MKALRPPGRWRRIAALVLVRLSSPAWPPAAAPAATSTPRRSSPASAKMKKIKGFHFVYEVHKPAVGRAGQRPGDRPHHRRRQLRGQHAGHRRRDPGRHPAVSSGSSPWATPTTSRTRSRRSGRPSPPTDSPVGTPQPERRHHPDPRPHHRDVVRGRGEQGRREDHHISGMVAAEEVKAIAGVVTTTETVPHRHLDGRGRQPRLRGRHRRSRYAQRGPEGSGAASCSPTLTPT